MSFKTPLTTFLIVILKFKIIIFFCFHFQTLLEGVLSLVWRLMFIYLSKFGTSRKTKIYCYTSNKNLPSIYNYVWSHVLFQVSRTTPNCYLRFCIILKHVLKAILLLGRLKVLHAIFDVIYTQHYELCEKNIILTDITFVIHKKGTMQMPV